MRALVISGGGSKGAFAGGLAQHFIEERGTKYDIFVGTSTGALLVPHLAIDRIAKIRHMYCNVAQRDIYKVDPFIIKQNPDGTTKVGINHFSTLKMFLRKEKTFGDTSHLRKTIASTLSEEDYQLVKNSGKKVVVTVSNISRTTLEHKYAYDCQREDFIDWMWASACFIPFMSLVHKDGYDYADGGLGNYIPIEEAISIGATEIDCIVLNTRRRPKKHVVTYNVFDLLIKSFLYMQKQVALNDVLLGHLQSLYNKDVKVNFYFTPRQLTEHSFYFEPAQMRGWWQEGLEYGRAKSDQR